MKKLMAIALGMALTMTTVVVAFGQDTTKKETTTKKKNKKGTTKTEKTEKKTAPTKTASPGLPCKVPRIAVRANPALIPCKRSAPPALLSSTIGVSPPLPHIARHLNQRNPHDSRRISPQHVRRVMDAQVDPGEPDSQRTTQSRPPDRHFADQRPPVAHQYLCQAQAKTKGHEGVAAGETVGGW